jgi:hypothetical protein
MTALKKFTEECVTGSFDSSTISLGPPEASTRVAAARSRSLVGPSTLPSKSGCPSFDRL